MEPQHGAHRAVFILELLELVPTRRRAKAGPGANEQPGSYHVQTGKQKQHTSNCRREALSPLRHIPTSPTRAKQSRSEAKRLGNARQHLGGHLNAFWVLVRRGRRPIKMLPSRTLPARVLPTRGKASRSVRDPRDGAYPAGLGMLRRGSSCCERRCWSTSSCARGEPGLRIHGDWRLRLATCWLLLGISDLKSSSIIYLDGSMNSWIHGSTHARRGPLAPPRIPYHTTCCSCPSPALAYACLELAKKQ